jgi:hypothetical protein
MVETRSGIDLPPILAKAADDVWHFLLETKGGDRIVFGSLEVVDREWVHLNPLDDAYPADAPRVLSFDAPHTGDGFSVGKRGLDIRIDSIAWVADGES